MHRKMIIFLKIDKKIIISELICPLNTNSGPRRSNLSPMWPENQKKLPTPVLAYD